MSNFNDMFTGVPSPEEADKTQLMLLLLKVRQIENCAIPWLMKWQ